MSRLHIHDRRERALVASADRLLGVSATLARPFRRRRAPTSPRRILLLRLERIGDLLMALPAIGDVRAAAPSAEIHLVVGSWNADIACAIEPVTAVQTLDARWLAREGEGLGMRSLIGAARRLTRGRYDLAINFEPDIRSNILLAASGAAWTAGYRSGGGGALLDLALDYDTNAHTTDNARRLVAAVFGGRVDAELSPAFVIPAEAHENAARLLSSARRPLVAVHVSGGRPIKQWDQEQFAEIARRLISVADATIVLTGSGGDRPLVDHVKQALPPARVVDVAGHVDLLTLAGILERVDVLVTGDTGPMHLATAVETPVVAIFGPSDPARYGPRGAFDRVVRVDLPCAPCNRIRLPPARCEGHVPDCLALVTVDSVFNAARSVLDRATHASPLRDTRRAHKPTA
jgi:ADP-heptose:LPS heptosyltransferase